MPSMKGLTNKKMFESLYCCSSLLFGIVIIAFDKGMDATVQKCSSQMCVSILSWSLTNTLLLYFKATKIHGNCLSQTLGATKMDDRGHFWQHHFTHGDYTPPTAKHSCQFCRWGFCGGFWPFVALWWSQWGRYQAECILQ